VIECDAETLRLLLRVCIIRKGNLLEAYQTEFDVICKTPKIARILREPVFAQLMRQNSEIREVGNGVPRENVNAGATPPVSNKAATGLFNHSKNMSDEPLAAGLVTNEQLKKRAKFMINCVKNQLTDRELLLLNREEKEIVDLLSHMDQSKHGIVDLFSHMHQSKHGQYPNKTPESSLTPHNSSATDVPVTSDTPGATGKRGTGNGSHYSLLNFHYGGNVAGNVELLSQSTFANVAILCAADTYLYQDPYAQFQKLNRWKGASASGSAPASKSNAGEQIPIDLENETPQNGGQNETPPNGGQNETPPNGGQNGTKEEVKNETPPNGGQNGTKEEDYFWDGSWDFLNNMNEISIMKVLEMFTGYTSVPTLINVARPTIVTLTGPLIFACLHLFWKMAPNLITASYVNANARSSVYPRTRS
jgi:hypothetical protein